MAAVVEVKNFVQCPEAIPPIAEMLFNQWFASRPGEDVGGAHRADATGARRCYPGRFDWVR